MDGVRSRTLDAASGTDALTPLYGRALSALGEAAEILGAHNVYELGDIDRDTMQRVARNMRATRAVIARILEDRGVELDPRSGPLHIENHTRSLARVLQQTTLAQIREVLNQPRGAVSSVQRLDEFFLFGVLHAAMSALRFAVWLETASRHTPPATTQMDAAAFRAALEDVRDDTARSLGGVIRGSAEPTPAPGTTELPPASATPTPADPRGPGRYAPQPSPSAPWSGSSRPVG